jgi:hypothetical protein
MNLRSQTPKLTTESDMNQYDKDLKMYAKVGLRTADDWGGFGREIQRDVPPRLETTHRGKLVGLYTREQTRLRSRDSHGAQ